MDIFKFKQLCDNAILNNASIRRTSNEAYDLIYNLCINHVDEVHRKSNTLIKHVVFENVFNGTSLTPYLSILQLIRDAAMHRESKDGNTSSISNLQFDEWHELISIAFSARENSCFFKEESPLMFFNKEVQFSKSCKKLSSYGIEFKYDEDKIIIKKESYSIILGIIDKYVNNIGGELILDYSFRILDRVFDSEQERFHIYRKTTQGVDNIIPEIPWGYIIAIGTTNLYKQQRMPIQEVFNEYQSFLEFMTNIVSCFEIQPYSAWEAMYVDNSKIIDFIQENVLYDNLISFFQFKSDYAIDIINNIRNDKRYKNLESFSFKFDDIIKVGLGIIQLSNVQNIKLIKKSHIIKKCGVSPDIVEKIIDIIFSNRKSNKLGFPPSSEAVDHFLYPLISYRSKYLALPKGITSLSVLNCVFNQISKQNGSFDNAQDSSVGDFLEQFIRHKLSQRGIKYYRGNFESKDKKIQGESDLIIKSTDCIYIIEMKKKSLTRKAMSGTDYQLISDLADSVMRSQAQCSKIEYILLSDKELILDIDGEKEAVTYNNEQIFKVSLSLHDFGALQDSVVLSTILETSMQVRFNAKDNDIEIGKKLEKWRKYVNQINQYKLKSQRFLSPKNDSFRMNKFMSIPQFFTVLNDSHNENEFSNLYRSSCSMTFSTRCFYKEYSLRKELYKRAK